jgi:hypothetical protein
MPEDHLEKKAVTRAHVPVKSNLPEKNEAWSTFIHFLQHTYRAARDCHETLSNYLKSLRLKTRKKNVYLCFASKNTKKCKETEIDLKLAPLSNAILSEEWCLRRSCSAATIL